MYPSQTSTIKYKAYNLGGVIANAIIAALSTLLMLPNNFYLLMMMIEQISLLFETVKSVFGL